MGNCCGSTSNNIGTKQTETLPKVFDDHHDIDTTSTTRSNTPFLGTPDPMGLGAGSSSPSDDTKMKTTTTTKAEEFVDHRLLSLLDFFRQLNVRRKDIYKMIIPVHRQEFEDIFKKLGNMDREEKQQHHMGGMLRQRSRSVGDESEGRKLERFKVKPIDSPNDGKSGGGDKGGGSSKPTGDGKGGSSKPAGAK